MAHRADRLAVDRGVAGAALPLSPRRRFHLLIRLAPLAAVALLLAAGYAFGLHEYLSVEALRGYRENLASFVEVNAVATAAVYVVLYVVAVAVSFPGAAVFTAAGGLMFGVGAGSALALFASTLGATLIFLVARTSFGETLGERAGPRLQRLRRGIQEEGFSYLLFVRLMPVFPFWIVNLAAAFFGIRLVPYVLATLIGVVPGTLVYSYFGASIGSAFAEGGSPFSLELLLGLALLAVMALLPVAYRKWRAGRQKEPGAAS
jgi:uncharacterized membrane protein YdjX (TVP38/TMEM64 family)